LLEVDAIGLGPVRQQERQDGKADLPGELLVQGQFALAEQYGFDAGHQGQRLHLDLGFARRFLAIDDQMRGRGIAGEVE
jgi:hypothetical protein